MQKATINNFFNMEAFSFKRETNHVSWHGAFYQQIAQNLIKAVYDKEVLRRVGNRLIALADQALILKETETVEHISHILTYAPLPREFQSIGHFYRVFCLKRRGMIDQARMGFQHLAESPALPLKFRARAIQTLGASYLERGEFDEAVSLYFQGAQAASTLQADDLPTTVNAHMVMAIHQSVNGDHSDALRQLENLRPLVRMLSPHQLLPRYMYTNSLAVELGELGRLEEARRLAEIAVRSPYAHVYPEWQETYEDILAKKMRRASPSTIAGVAWPRDASGVALLPVGASNVVTMPVSARPAVSLDVGAARPQPARVITYHGWQQPLPDPAEALPETFTPDDLKQMTIADKQAALLDVIYSDDVSHDTLDPLLVVAGKVTTDSPAN